MASSSTSETEEATSSCSVTTPALLPLGFSNVTGTANVVGLFTTFPSMNVSLSEVNTGTTFISETYISYDTYAQGATKITESYSVIYASATTYKVEVSELQGQSVFNATAWILRNGTAVAYDYLGVNITGVEATGLYQGLMTPFFLESEYSTVVPILASAPGVQESTGEAELGSNQLSVTNYTATLLPLNATYCDSSVTLSSTSLQIGGVRGGESSLITSLTASGTEVWKNRTYVITSLDFTLNSFTLGS